jgi:hypothetical protein
MSTKLGALYVSGVLSGAIAFWKGSNTICLFGRKCPILFYFIFDSMLPYLPDVSSAFVVSTSICLRAIKKVEILIKSTF